MSASIRADLYFGAVYGLALSAGVWTFVLAPPGSPWDALGLTPLAIAAGTLVTRTRWLGSLTPIYPAAVAGAWIGGPAVSVGAALLTAVTRRMLGPAASRVSCRRTLSFELSNVVLAASLAAVAFEGARSALTPRGLLIQTCGALVLHGALWALVLRVTGRLEIRLRRGSPGPRSGRRVIRPALRYAMGAAIGSALALVWSAPEGPFLLVSIAVLVLAGAAVNSRMREHRLREHARLETAAVCASVIGGLSRLVEARDAGTLEHLRRVQRMCLEVGTRMGLCSSGLEALSSAALLHDLGKLAVPEGILSKPGRLNAEEMARMRIHPEVGASVLESIPFPYPLAPIVRHHHERWDGQGYPEGLRGEEIPAGARILAAVDSFDALTTDRPYRRAVSREQGLAFLEQEAGQTFDPAVIEVLVDHLEHAESGGPAHEPGPTLVATASPERTLAGGSLPRSQRELQTLYEIARAREHGLGLEEYLTLVACKLRRLVPHASFVVYVLDPADSLLHATFAIGDAADKLAGMTIPLGERLSGWAAMQRRAFVGNDHRSPIDRDGCRSDLEDWSGDERIAALGSTLVAPMVLDERAVGTVTLYDDRQRRFTPEERRLLVRVAGYVAQVTDRLRERGSEDDRSLTDPLTGVPNARFLRLESAHRVARERNDDDGFGLLAFRVGGLEQVGERSGSDEADRLLCRIARRFAASCTSSETLVRFGQEMFLVLTSAARSGELVERWHDLRNDVEHPPLILSDGAPCSVRLSAAHATFPEDGRDLDALLETLDARLSLAEQRRVVPFRAAAAVPRQGRTA